jgi:hypothetical protein
LISLEHDDWHAKLTSSSAVVTAMHDRPMPALNVVDEDPSTGGYWVAEVCGEPATRDLDRLRSSRLLELNLALATLAGLIEGRIARERGWYEVAE